MASITLKGLPDSLKEQIEEMADRERRSLNQQVIYLLERAVREKVESFGRTYRRFRKNHGSSPLEDNDLEGLRSEESGREVDLWSTADQDVFCQDALLGWWSATLFADGQIAAIAATEDLVVVTQNVSDFEPFATLEDGIRLENWFSDWVASIG